MRSHGATDLQAELVVGARGGEGTRTRPARPPQREPRALSAPEPASPPAASPRLTVLLLVVVRTMRRRLGFGELGLPAVAALPSLAPNP